ncbi:hypothetical protein ACFW1M_22300 [Streptomyces inhibens]|uniref:hypothetical protein n=1 Tax=Streptomyces inhibens TaxID=2293571 RepID=UPI0036AB4A43
MTTSSTLFHYTSTACWDEICESGFIDTTSRAAHRMEGQFKHVWLTDGTPEATGLRDMDRTVVRISIAPVPSILYWPLWRELCSNREAVEAAGGDPATWYLSDRTIAAKHWGQVIRMDTHEVLLNPYTAPPPLSFWATMPTPARIAEAARRLDQLRPLDGFRAWRIDQQISKLRTMADRGEAEQRQRAAWRTPKAEIAAFQDQH